MDRKQYSSTRFVALTDNESIRKAKKTYFIWIITVTILFCVSAAYFSYKTIIAPDYFNDKRPQPSTSNNDFKAIVESDNFPLKLYNRKKFLQRFENQTTSDGAEFNCEESLEQLNIVEPVFIKEIFLKRFDNIDSYINLDLILHYEYIVNKYDAKSLKSIFNEYQSKLSLAKNSEDFIVFLMGLKSNKFQFYANYLKQEKYVLELKCFEKYFALTEELNHWYNYLDRLRGFLSSYEQQKLRQYFTNCTEKNFKKYTEQTQKRVFHFVYSFNVNEKKLQEINLVINEWAEPVKTEVYNISVIFYSKVVILSEINKKTLDLKVKSLANVFVFASHTIYLDEDVELSGVNLAMIAPNWVFIKKIIINLNGSSGEEHMNETANPNQPGKPGNPGENAGNFFGVGNPHEKFLFVSADGGKGGNGQNGAKGRDGIDNTHPGPPVNKPACMAKVNTFKNSFGQVITHYKIYNPAGCGSSGTDGGIRGRGGAGGVITLITRNSVKTRKGLTGSPGAPGKGGAGGAGGRNGCYYEVFDVDDEILHRVTIVKCPPSNVLPAGNFGKDNHNTYGQIFPPVKENLIVRNCFLWFIQFAGSDLIKYNDDNAIMFLKEFKNFYVNNQTDLKNIITEYKLSKDFDNIKFYELYNEKLLKYTEPRNNKISLLLKYLKIIVLGRMILLKDNINFLFIDPKTFLNVLKSSIRNANDFDMQPISYLNKKIEIKLEHIKLNLKSIKRKVRALSSGSENDIRKFYVGNDTKSLSKALEKNNFLCIMTHAVDVINEIISGISKNLSFNFTQGLVTENTLLLPKETCFRKVSEISIELSLAKINFSNKNHIKKNLEKLKDFLRILKESDSLSSEIKNLAEELIDELEHFIALHYSIEWKEWETLFSESLDNLMLSRSLDSEKDEEEEFLKSELVNVLSSIMRKLAVDTVRVHLPPFINLNTRLQLFEEKVHTNDVLAQINFLQEIPSQEITSFCKNHLKAVFDKPSAVGEFYFWPNVEIKDKLQKLFSGAEINLKSNLINRHVFDKNFIQFRTLKLDFECNMNRNSCEQQLRDILLNFKVDIIHSGYSYYSWEGETHIVVSEKVSLEYSFRMLDSKEPEVYNSLFKKCQNGEIKLSPFTTWTIRLFPLNNNADFTKLLPFVNSVNLKLVGTGTYIT